MKGFIAKFGSPEALIAALQRLHEEGYRKLDTFTPFPLPEAAELLGGSTSRIGWIAAISALFGGGLTYAMIYWTSVIGYPLNVGGRDLHSWPAFLPAALVAAALWSGIATLIVMLWMAGLPRWHHPLFDVGQFDRVTYDKFMLLVEGSDPAFSEEKTYWLLQSLGPEHIEEVPS